MRKGMTERRELVLEISKRRTVSFVNLETGEIFEDETCQKSLKSKNPETLTLKIPVDVKGIAEIHRTDRMSPVYAIANNRTIWPKNNARSLRLFVDNDEWPLVTEDGKFDEKIHSVICLGKAYKKYAILCYQMDDGTKKCEIWWRLE